MSDSTDCPTPEEFYTSTGLYHELPLEHIGHENVLGLEYFTGTIDTYCVDCKKDSIFTGGMRPPFPSSISTFDQMLTAKEVTDISQPRPRAVPLRQWAFRSRTVQRTWNCTRDGKHTIMVMLTVAHGSLQKTGQYPSVADLMSGTLKRFDRVFDKKYRREMGRAIGLFSHGIGAGSLLYLRRVFEHEIDLARAEARKMPGWKDEEFVRLRMEDKIQALKGYLPEKLVTNSGMYSIMGKGVHELTDEECNRYFPVVRQGIESILQEKLDKLHKAEQDREIDNAIAQAVGELKK